MARRRRTFAAGVRRAVRLRARFTVVLTLTLALALALALTLTLTLTLTRCAARGVPLEVRVVTEVTEI